MTRKYSFLNIKSYLVGNFRYKVFYSKWFKWLMLPHIREQIKVRIKSMNPVCFRTGSCEICGCATTALQMANKACDAPCYPTMMSTEKWGDIKKGGKMYDKALNIFWELKEGKFEEIKLK